jgi:hypothetical protein
MTVSVRTFPPRRLLALGILAASAFLQGCLSYREQVELNPDGTGRARIALGVPTTSDDPDKAAEVQGTVKRLRGIRWVARIDSSRNGLRWRGGEVEFDSVEALRRLNGVLPVENLFGRARMVDSGGVGFFTRTMTIPSASSSDSREVFEVHWRFPGQVLSTDRHAIRDSGSNEVRWRLVAHPSEERTYRLTVRWRIPLLRREIAGTPSEKKLLPWVVGVAGANLLFALGAVIAVGRARRRARRAIDAKLLSPASGPRPSR